MSKELYNNWFEQRRFGLFVHWGLYAVPAWHEQIQMRKGMDKKDYQKLMMQLDPYAFNPEEWLDLIEQAGMKYICFTTKHHDGFCMWDTKHTDYKITNTHYGKDVLKMLTDACAKRDIGVSLYYSIPDWHHPNAYNPLSTHQVPSTAEDMPDMEKYIEYVKNQTTELCSNYGKILSFFWDIPPKHFDPSLNENIRKLQPGIMINDRGFDEGDYSTPERHVPDGIMFVKPTEACQSVGRQSWGYREEEDYYSDKFLMQSITKIMAMGGNYLLNIGPKADGSIAKRHGEILKNIGKWYHAVKESFEGAKPVSNLFDRKDMMFTRKENELYLHLIPEPECTGVILNPITVLPKRAVVLNNGCMLKTTVEEMPTLYGKGVYLHISGIPVNALIDQVIIIKLEFNDLDKALESTSDKKLSEQRL